MNLAKSLGRFLGYCCLRSCLLFVPLLPLSVLLVIGRRLGDIIRTCSARRRRIADRNLRIAYGAELRQAERDAIAADSFRQFGMFVFEGMWFAFVRSERADPYLVMDPASESIIRDTFSLGRGVIFVSAHFGNFELAARAIVRMGYPITVVARPARDKRTTRLMEEARRRNGMTPVLRDSAARPMLAALRRGEAVALLADQNAEDVYVPFFGQPTGTVDGPARLSLRTGAPIMVGICRRDPGPRYVTLIEGVVHPDPNAPREAEVRRIMAEVNRLLEAVIRRNPEQWLWFHNRWRSSPDVRVGVSACSGENNEQPV